MSKVAVVYWTGTGNTQAMAQSVIAGVQQAGAEATELFAADFKADDVSKYDAIAFGCPAMGAEVLEESVFQPMWDSVKGHLSGKKIGLFGSYGWGGGAWLENWYAEAESLGADVVDHIAVENAPDETVKAQCEALGEKLAQ